MDERISRMIRDYNQGDESKIVDLFSEVFKKELSLYEWEWKYKRNTQQKTIVCVDEEEQAIVGHVALIPTIAKWFDIEVMFGARTDTMVSPQHQGKGIYKKLNLRLLNEAKIHEVDFLYGFPAAKAKELLIRYIEAEEITYVPRLMLIQSLSNLIAMKLPHRMKWAAKLLKVLDKKTEKLEIPSSYRIEKLSEFNDEFDCLWEKAKDIENILNKRDSNYLNWRYVNHPTKEYDLFGLYKEKELVGYVVVHIEEKAYGTGTLKFGTIVDAFGIDDSEVWQALIIQSKLALQEADIIQTWALTHTLFYQQLKAQSFLHKDSPMPLVGKVINENLSRKGFDVQNWFLTPGDVDSF